MSTSMRLGAIGRGLVIISLLLLPLRLAVYLANKVLILAGYVSGALFLVGISLWLVGAVMAGYTERRPKKLEP